RGRYRRSPRGKHTTGPVGVGLLFPVSLARDAILDRAANGNRFMAVRMSKTIFVSLLALLVLSSLVSSRVEPYSGQPLFSQAVTVEIATAPADDGHAAGTSR